LEVRQLAVSDELLERGISGIYYNNEKIEICFKNTEGTEDIIRLAVMTDGMTSINRLDEEVNGLMTPEAKQSLKLYLISELVPIWQEIHPTPNKEEKEKKDIHVYFNEVRQQSHKLFVDEYDIPYIAIPIGEHLEVFAIDSHKFRDWYRMFIYEQKEVIMSDETINKLCSLARAYAASRTHGEQINLNLRTASNIVNNKLEWMYDLTNSDWEFVRITSDGWYLMDKEIIFRRYGNQRPQAYPVQKYEPDVFDKFMKLVNIKATDESSNLLLRVYIVHLFIPAIQKAMLALHGSQGAGKSFLEEMIKSLVDPAMPKTLSLPRDKNQLIQQLSHNHVAYYDNISLIPYWISDEFCRAVSGSGSSIRKLYTDDDDIIRFFKRAVGFNGINLAATKPDLLDRVLIIQLERIDESKWLDPQDILKEFEALKPELLGYIFDILVKVLKWKNEGGLILDKLSRMAEFVQYGEMISRCMGHKENEFIDAYRQNRKRQDEEVIESSALAIVVIKLLESGNIDRITPTTLLTKLEEVAIGLNINIIRDKSFPRNATWLGRRLNEIKINLREYGLEIEWSEDNQQRRVISIRKIASIASIVSIPENQAQKEGKNIDTKTDTIVLDSTNSVYENEKNQAQKGRVDAIDSIYTKIRQTGTGDKKCPYCDYRCEPYMMKVHLEGAHGESQDLDIREER
jgi:hypothetical protein